MVSKVRRPARPNKVSYELLEHFSELLICGRCYRNNVRKPVRQLLSPHHRPLALCHECSQELHADNRARILELN